MDRAWCRPFQRLGGGVLGLFLIGACVMPWVPAPVDLHERLVVTAFGIGVYTGVLALAVFLFGRGVRREGEALRSAMGRCLGWVQLWTGLVVSEVAVGVVIGMLLFLGVGGLLGVDATWTERLMAGARDGGFYVFVWAPGLSLVICFMLAFGPRAKASKSG